MKKILTVAAAISLLFALSAYAGDKGTPAEAEALVKKAISYIKANGKDKAFAEFSNPKGQFVDRDLYIFVYDMDGRVLAHGQNARMVGRDLSDAKDPSGKEFVKERIELAKTKGQGWQHYQFSNPLSKKIEDKTAYIEKVDNFIVGSSAYK